MLRELAIRTLFHDRGKLVAGLIGVVFSVVLVNVQGGLFLGLIRKASLLIDRSEADIWIGHRGMHNVDFPHSIPERWRRRVESVPGVKEVAPLRIGFSEISLPDGHYEGVVVVGIDRASSMGHVYGDLTGDPDPLAGVDSVVVDACDAEKLQHPELGELREIGGRRVRITSNSYGILSFLVTPYVFTDYEHAATLTPIQPGEASYLLAQVQAGVDADATCEEIMRRLPDVTAMPSTTFADVSVKFWMTRTGLGISFGASTMLGLLVGLVMVGQTLYAMVLDRIQEFATLKAIGASGREVLSVLITQSATVALLGIIIGTLLAATIRVILSTPIAEIRIPPGLYAGSAGLVFVICMLASGLPYLRVRSVDPHSILQG